MYVYKKTGPVNGWDVRQGTADADDMPAEVREKAEAIAGTFPSYVKW